MFRVVLITKNNSLVDFCAKNLPDSVQLKAVPKLNFKNDISDALILFDSAALAESTDAIVSQAAERYGARDGAVSLGILLDDDHRHQAFSLFPENLRFVSGTCMYRMQGSKVTGLTAAEWRWFLETQRRQLGNLHENTMTLQENRNLLRRIADIRSEVPASLRFPAFMHGRSAPITRFRDELLRNASQSAYVYLQGRGDIPVSEFIEYYAALIRPESPAEIKIFDLEKMPPHLHPKAVKQKERILCLQNIHLLAARQQAALMNTLRNLGENEEKSTRYILVAPPEIGQKVKKGHFLQELYSFLRRSALEVPPLYDRASDISHIAAEYIHRREYKPLSEHSAVLATKILSRFDLSSGYRGLYLTLDLMHDLEKSRGTPVFELMKGIENQDVFEAARSFLREQVEPDPATMFQNLAGGEKEALSLDFVERNYIAAVCERYAWQVTEAARHLKISRKTLYDKMRRYKLNRPEDAGRTGTRKVS